MRTGGNGEFMKKGHIRKRDIQIKENETFSETLAKLLKEAYDLGLSPKYLIIGVQDAKIWALEAGKKEMVPLFLDDEPEEYEYDFIDDKDVN